jgi:hypothetical protein
MDRHGATFWGRLAARRRPARGDSEPAVAARAVFWPALLSGAMVLAGCVAAAALICVVSFLINDSLPGRAQDVLASMYLWKVDHGARLVGYTNLRIILVNCMAALLFAQFGSAAALLEGTLRRRFPSYDRLERLSGRRLARAMSRLYAPLREITDGIAQETAALAVAFPFIALAANGIAIGVLLGSTALAGSSRLASALAAFWPHGVFEIPALLLAAAVGCAAGMALAEAGRSGLGPLLWAARVRLTSARVWLALAGAFALLVLAGAVEPVPHRSGAKLDRAALSPIMEHRFR